jgi:hypothetical protein
MPSTAINTAIARLLRRAEEEDPATLAETFVDVTGASAADFFAQLFLRHIQAAADGENELEFDSRTISSAEHSPEREHSGSLFGLQRESRATESMF